MTGSGNWRRSARLAALAAGLSVATSPAAAQLTAAPATADSTRLSDALRTLARNPQSYDALMAAGEASLRVDDADAALGFLRRAQIIRPQDARAKAGLAAVMVRQRQPLEALRLFAEAEQGGGLTVAHIGDRGLAYDLIGDNARAQRDYQVALAAGPDPVITRRMALSLAIAGQQSLSEATLLPLLQRQDLAAYRTRAFMLAIMGKGEEAVSIAQTMLPATLSGRMAPYLRFMPRLTHAQQAAAANLGAFPPSDAIGRDDPALAAYAASIGVAPAQTADSRLVPSGAPLGRTPAPAATTSARPAVRAASRATPPPVEVAANTPVARAGRTPLPTPVPTPVQPLAPPPATVQQPAQTAPPAAAAPTLPAPASVPSPTVAPAPTAAVATPAALNTGALQGPPALAAPVPVLSAPPPAASFTAAAEPVSAAAEPVGQPAPVVVARLEESPPPAPSVAQAPDPAPRPVSLSEAFADLRAVPPAASAAPAKDAVDITRIQPKRQVATSPKPPAPPKPPPVPSRQWVQVATGRDTKALAFDWKRIKREAGGLLDKQAPMTADWGQTNRLVVGPFATTAAADQLMGKLKDKKIDAFRFTSAVGEAVTALP